MLGNFGLLSFMRSWNLTRFLTTSISATLFRIWTFSAFLYISETTRTNFFKIIMYIKMSETFIKIDSLQHLEISRQTYPTNGQKSTLQHSPFWSYANFSKLMRAIHISVTSTFQCEYCQCFTFKRCDKFKLKCTSQIGRASCRERV